MPGLIETILDLRGGELAANGSQKLAELVNAICETGKKGKLSLVIELKPSKMSMNEVTELMATGHVTINKPEADIGSSVFFPLKDENGAISGGISRHDPLQLELQLEMEKQEEQQASKE